MPEANIILGVSNISFGLNPAARVVLNSVFLHECVEAGMNSAIVNASKILPLKRFNEHEIEVALDLIYDRRKFDGDICTYDPLGEFTTMFQGKTAKSMKPDISNLPIEEKLKHHIIDGEKIGLEDHLKIALEKYPALEIINDILLGGMKVVGDLFGSGQMQLPFVLQSAEVDESGGEIPRTVYGKGRGEQQRRDGARDRQRRRSRHRQKSGRYYSYQQRLQGRKSGHQTADRRHSCGRFGDKCDAIGMSGLLVKSTLVMRDNLEMMNERGINIPVILGGAALNRRYVDNDLMPIYNGKLFYARDAFDGLHAMDDTDEQRSRVEESSIR